MPKSLNRVGNPTITSLYMIVSQLLLSLLMGGFLGFMGQGIRTLIGLKKLLDQAPLPLSQHPAYDRERLFLSLFLGFIAGAISMLGFIDDTGKAVLTHTTLIALLGVGYAGTDFIESFLSKYSTGSLPVTTTSKPTASVSEDGTETTTHVTATAGVSTAKVAALWICFLCGGMPAHSLAQTQKKTTYSTDTQVKEFVPVDPFMYDMPVTITDSTGQIDTLSLQKLALNNRQMLRFLANEGAQMMIKEIDEDGQVTFLTNTLSGKNSTYCVVVDYSNFTTIKVFDAQKQLTGTAKLGVGVRLTARLQTREAGLNIGDLFSLALAAERKQVIGSLSIDIVGITSDQVTALVPLPSEISLTSIQAAMQALASIKAKIYEDTTTLLPQVLAIKPEQPTYTSHQVLQDMQLPDKLVMLHR